MEKCPRTPMFYTTALNLILDAGFYPNIMELREDTGTRGESLNINITIVGIGGGLWTPVITSSCRILYQNLVSDIGPQKVVKTGAWGGGGSE